MALNCASFSETLLESELFGHVKGSFTGAYRDKIGKLQQAHRGTIFLDEIAEMSLRMQAMLLRFLENGEIQPVGSDAAPMRVDVRVHLRDQPRSAGDGREGRVPGGPALSHQGDAHSTCRRCASGKDDIRALIAAHDGEGRATGSRSADEAMALLESDTDGRATSASCRTSSSRWRRCDGERRSASTSFRRASPRRRAASAARPGAPATGRRRAVRRAGIRRPPLLGRRASAVHEPRLTRNDLRQLIRRGLAATGGNYRGLLQLFGMDDTGLQAAAEFPGGSHECAVDFREFRQVSQDLMKPAPGGERPIALAR